MCNYKLIIIIIINISSSSIRLLLFFFGVITELHSLVGDASLGD